MKPIIILLLSGLILNLTCPAFAADKCTVCPRVDDLLQRMDKIAPDPMNESTAEAQEKLSGEALNIVQASLTERAFTSGNAKSIVKLIVKTIPYDNSLDFERANMAAFKRLYHKKGSLLKATIEDMQKSGEISTKDKTEMLQLFGVIPSTATEK